MQFKELVKKIIWPNRYNNEAFVSFLKKKGAKIGRNTRFIEPRKCHVDVGRAEYITIGDNCCLSCANILAHDYSWYVLKDAYDEILPDPGGKVEIGNNCFIGFNSTILKNTIIGDNVIIAAGAVVKGVIPSNTVWGGGPAKQICTLEEMLKKKINSRIEDAYYRYSVVRNNKGNVTISDMGMFSYLFLERTEDNYNAYLRDIEFNGIKENDVIKEYFFKTKPVFDGFEKFVEAYQRKQLTDK